MGDVERNIGLVRRLEDAYNARDYDIVREIVAADLVPHTPGSQMMPPGVEGAIAANEGASRTPTSGPRSSRSSGMATRPCRTSG